MSELSITAIMPFFIVSDFARSLAFYRDRLGFQPTFAAPDPKPFFGIVARGSAFLMLKEVGVPTTPNSLVHKDARFDAFVSTTDPDDLAAELSTHGVVFDQSVADTHDGQRGFQIRDPDGHVLFFGRPQ